MTIFSNVGSLKNQPSATVVWPVCWNECSFKRAVSEPCNVWLYKYLFLVA